MDNYKLINSISHEFLTVLHNYTLKLFCYFNTTQINIHL